ncbi:e3 ubiquitin-protein ligase [Anaeramoeba flamelloides]|uniref:E3 ubiquitin-protein ligase n=1 Tax=Anaeramoeba flamelloides TaxID=1746091 RepID=A0AAV7YFB1_9EUKA|nr:e3 ubiquitin-protein ligase [Anaeramoeba flamelloides]
MIPKESENKNVIIIKENELVEERKEEIEIIDLNDDDDGIEEIKFIPSQKNEKKIPQSKILFNQVKEILPNIEPIFLKKLISSVLKSNVDKMVGRYDLFTWLMDYLTTNLDYPKIEEKKKRGEGKRENGVEGVEGVEERKGAEERKEANGVKQNVIMKNKKMEEDINWYEIKLPVSSEYKKFAVLLLQNEFQTVSIRNIKKEFTNSGFRFSPAHRKIMLYKPTVYFIRKGPRKKVNFEEKIIPRRLILEREFVQLQMKKQMELNDQKLAMKINDQEYEKFGAKLTCMCCYVPVSFVNMVSCKDGHLFCCDCLYNLVKHSIGQRKKEIRCPCVTKCEFGFSDEMLKKAVPENVLKNYQQLVQDSEIQSAGIKNLKKCPFCNYAVIIENPNIGNTNILECKNIACLKVSCLLCGNEAHKGKTCEEAKEKKGTDFRTYIEEEMIRALLSTCNKCGQNYFKTKGCNKIVCSFCGESMCYLCQKSINKEKYKHFSNKAGHCKLWTTIKDDEQNIKEAKKIAKLKVNQMRKNLKNKKN